MKDSLEAKNNNAVKLETQKEQKMVEEIQERHNKIWLFISIVGVLILGIVIADVKRKKVV